MTERDGPMTPKAFHADVLAAAPAIGLKVQILKAGTDREIETAFTNLVQARTEVLLVGADLFFNSRIKQIVRFPTVYSYREFVMASGLISYGMSLVEQYREVGLYAGRILKGV